MSKIEESKVNQEQEIQQEQEVQPQVGQEKKTSFPMAAIILAFLIGALSYLIYLRDKQLRDYAGVNPIQVLKDEIQKQNVPSATPEAEVKTE